jgi:hypothetical protein
MKLSEQFRVNSYDAGKFTISPFVLETNLHMLSIHTCTWEGVYSEIMRILNPEGVVYVRCSFSYINVLIRHPVQCL